MPAFRNLGAPQRVSARLEKRTPVLYDDDGWPITDGLDSAPQPAHEPGACDIIERDNAARSVSPNPAPTLIPSSILPTDASPEADDEAPPPLLSSASTSNATNNANTNATTPSRKSHSRRRDASHVPRPRNAFIFFRSHFVATKQASGEGQQNELSKLAGKAWKQMSDEEKAPFMALAAVEKKQHAIDHPNYVYTPGKGGSTGRSGKARAAAAAAARKSSVSALAHKRRASLQKARVAAEWDSDDDEEEEEEEDDSAAVEYVPPPPRTTRAPRAAAKRAVELMEHLPSTSPCASPESIPVDDAEPKSLFAELNPDFEGFVPTDDIPELELTPSSSSKELMTPTLYVPSIPEHQDASPLAPGLRSYLPNDTVNPLLPMLPGIRYSRIHDQTLNELQFDYSPLASPISVSDALEQKPFVSGIVDNFNFNYYDAAAFAPVQDDVPMKMEEDDDFFRMYLNLPRPMELSP